MDALLHMKLLKIYVQANTEVKGRVAAGKVSCHCKKGSVYFQT